MLAAVFLLLGLLMMVLLIAMVSTLAFFSFNKKVKKEVRELFDRNLSINPQIIQQEDLEGLPPCVQKWMVAAQVAGKIRIASVRLKQKAMMRLGPEKSWMPADVKQYFTVDKPGFIWKAYIKAAPFFHIAGRDKYEEGKGNMLIQLLSWIKMADATGKEIDQGTLLRFLAECMWFPTAALSSYIQWEEIDCHTARATMSYKGQNGSGVFTFNEQGQVHSFEAKRYMEAKGAYSLEDWVVVIHEYKVFQEVKIPAKGEVIWKLKTGDFSWYQFEITDVEYNRAEVYKD